MTIKDICQKFDLRHAELAHRFGIPKRTVEDWHAGRRKPPGYVEVMIEQILKLQGNEVIGNNPGAEEASAELQAGNIIVNVPDDIDCNMKQWDARYEVQGSENARVIRIEARSAIDVVVAKVAEKGFLGPQVNYYISSSNFGVAIPGIGSLQETFWIMEQLMANGMSTPDAVTVAQVLRDLGDF